MIEVINLFSMKSVIIGMGEAGSALYQILNKHYPTETYDKRLNKNIIVNKFDILHVCFSYNEDFISEVKRYQKQFKPQYTIIHSSVPVGTSRKCNALHSPIRGLHPNLTPSLLVFPKFIGGQEASQVADYFRRADINVILCDDPETTELGKLLDTEYYRACIEFTKRAKELCNQHDVNFHEVYTLFNQTYNESFTKLGHPEFVRPVLQPIMKEIGGHCIIPNSKFLNLRSK